jgi:hypothetical protein
MPASHKVTTTSGSTETEWFFFYELPTSGLSSPWTISIDPGTEAVDIETRERSNNGWINQKTYKVMPINGSNRVAFTLSRTTTDGTYSGTVELNMTRLVVKRWRTQSNQAWSYDPLKLEVASQSVRVAEILSPTAASVTTRLSFGDPSTDGVLNPDPNRAEGYVKYTGYKYKGGLFVGVVGEGTNISKDRSGRARTIVGYTAPTLQSGETAARSTLQLYSLGVPAGFPDISISASAVTPPTTQSSWTSNFVSTGIADWASLAAVTTPSALSLTGNAQVISSAPGTFRWTAPWTPGQAVAMALNTDEVPPSSGQITGVWAYFVGPGQGASHSSASYIGRVDPVVRFVATKAGQGSGSAAPDHEWVSDWNVNVPTGTRCALLNLDLLP